MRFMVDEQKKAKLMQHLSTLRTELDALSRTHPDRAKTIAGFAELSAHEATQADTRPELLELAVRGLRKSVQELETTHPRLVEVVGSLSAALSGVGL
jgi:hypothetical protein